MALRGRSDEGIALIPAEPDSSVGVTFSSNLSLRLSSEAHARAGNLREALATIERVLFVIGKFHIDLPATLWWRGELRVRLGDRVGAATDFQQATELARRMGSKAHELRATTSLARLLAKQGKRDEARAMLAEIYNWFTADFDSTDLKDAKVLLDKLSA